MLLTRLLLYIATAIAELVGCYLPYLWMRDGRSSWLLVPAGGSLALFTWLLTLHPVAAGRTYAALWRRLYRRGHRVALDG